jgi:hypothetical protein
MPFYKVTPDSGATALKLILVDRKEATGNKKYHSKFELEGQNKAKFQVVRIHNIRQGTLGLYLGTNFSYRVGHPEDKIPMVELLVGEERLYFYAAHVILVTPEEIEHLKEESK